MFENDFGLSAPWVIYAKKLEKFFEEDPDVKIEYYDNDPNVVNIIVSDPIKYFALNRLIDAEIEFGNVHLQVFIFPSNKFDNADLFKMAFKDSPIVKSIDEIQPEGSSNKFTYISFRNRVVKYWADYLGDPHGNLFTLYQYLADDIFLDHDGVFFTTAEE